MSDLIQIPIAEIDEAAVTRDRIWHDAEAAAELEGSIAGSGLRHPVEVFPLEEPRGERRYGLIAGLRRLRAFRALHARTGEARFTAIPAFVLERRDMMSLVAAVVEENEVRAQVSPFERGWVCAKAHRQQLFGSIDAAVEGLYPNASKQKRRRLRVLAMVADEMDGFFDFPETLTERQMERIAAAITAGFGELIRTALDESSLKDASHQWRLVASILAEAEAHAKSPEVSHLPGRPRRVLRPIHGLTVRRERLRNGWALHFTGRQATGPMMNLVLDDIELKYGGE